MTVRCYGLGAKWSASQGEEKDPTGAFQIPQVLFIHHYAHALNLVLS